MSIKTKGTGNGGQGGEIGLGLVNGERVDGTIAIWLRNDKTEAFPDVESVKE
jgi:hypothetical protein